MLRRRGLSVSPRFLWECLTSRTVSPFPAPATSHAACGFPVLCQNSALLHHKCESFYKSPCLLPLYPILDRRLIKFGARG